MKQKRFDIGFVKMNMEDNGSPKGLVLKREATLDECRHILQDLLGFDILDNSDEYKAYNEEILNVVNKWLTGYIGDWAISEFKYDHEYESPGMMKMVTILTYLKKQEII